LIWTDLIGYTAVVVRSTMQQAAPANYDVDSSRVGFSPIKLAIVPPVGITRESGVAAMGKA
jgi:hypothetical protein